MAAKRLSVMQKTEAPPVDNPVLKSNSIRKVKDEVIKLQTKLDKFKDTCWCYMCGAHKSKEHFYVSTDPKIQSGYAPICRECARKLALRVDKNGEEHEPTKESVQLALKYLNKPFINVVWDASIQESQNLTLGKTKTNVWTSYIKNISMVNYVGMTWEDSDMFKEHIIYDDEKTEQQLVEEHNGQDTYDSYLKNKEDVIRLLDYDPFEQEPVRDQPFLYSQLLGMLDASEDANEDMLRVSSAIQIVRAFLQSAKIDDAIAKLMGDIISVQQNSATIKSLQDSKQKLTSMITNLAAESCLSLKNSKKQTRGSDTWTGKLKTIRDLNLRDGQVNGFDIQTARAMAQIQEISDASIMKQLALDESEWSDIVADMRVDNQRLRKEKESYKEINRILLKENLDLKDYLEEKGITLTSVPNLKDLYSVFSDEDDGIEFAEGLVIDDGSDNPSV